VRKTGRAPSYCFRPEYELAKALYAEGRLEKAETDPFRFGPVCHMPEESCVESARRRCAVTWYIKTLSKRDAAHRPPVGLGTVPASNKGSWAKPKPISVPRWTPPTRTGDLLIRTGYSACWRNSTSPRTRWAPRCQCKRGAGCAERPRLRRGVRAQVLELLDASTRGRIEWMTQARLAGRCRTARRRGLHPAKATAARRQDQSRANGGLTRQSHQPHGGPSGVAASHDAEPPR